MKFLKKQTFCCIKKLLKQIFGTLDNRKNMEKILKKTAKVSRFYFNQNCDIFIISLIFPFPKLKTSLRLLGFWFKEVDSNCERDILTEMSHKISRIDFKLRTRIKKWRATFHSRVFHPGSASPANNLVLFYKFLPFTIKFHCGRIKAERWLI